MSSTPVEGTPAKRSALRRYTPLLAVLVVVAVVVGAFALLRDGDDDTAEPAEPTGGALTFDEAREQGIDTSDWHNCDQSTGRIALPYPYTPPCVAPAGDEGNGGATAPGVTADEIKVVVYQTDPDRDAALLDLLGLAFLDTDPVLAGQTTQAYAELLNEHYETYGRRVVVEFYTGTGSALDAVAARNDAIRIAEMEPFAVWGGPILQTVPFAQELTARGILCIQQCTVAPSLDRAIESLPYLWSTGPALDQAAIHISELIGKQLTGRNAEFAGDESFHDRERVFGLVNFNDVEGAYTPLVSETKRMLAEGYDTEFAVEHEYFQESILNPGADAQTFIGSLKSAGVTTVVFMGDPVFPRALTEAATQNDYFPEWIVGPSVYADTTVLARQFDQEQWAHAFGLSLPAARGDQAAQTSYALYTWQYCEAPPSNTYTIQIQGPQILFTGIHMAGPDLTPDSFMAGLFKYPPTGGDPTIPLYSWGEHGIWRELDPDGTDDATAVFWNPEATGVDEAGNEGAGMYEYVRFGERYRPYEWPDDELPWFDTSQSLTLVEELPEEDLLPAYPSPCGGPELAAPSGRGSSG